MILTYSDIILRLVLSIVLSGLIGVERERINKPAGLRTHILVSIGAGFYVISLVGTFLVFLTLVLLSKIEISRSKKSFQFITITAINRTGQLGKIAEEMGIMKTLIKNIEMDTSDEEKVKFNFLLKLTTEISKEELIENISKVEGVLSVKF